MPKWLRKTLVVAITILTFGLVSPSTLFLQDSKSDEPIQPDFTYGVQTDSSTNEESEDRESFLASLIEQAEQAAWMKFGTKIGPVIEDEFREKILPQIENIIFEVASQFSDHEVKNLAITEQPTGGISEKIFHVYDQSSGRELLRFHVRREHPPLEGYWFNFHYHKADDSFQTHHDLGRIYWDKNTPPNWMS
jgi:hypothetical protein